MYKLHVSSVNSYTFSLLKEFSIVYFHIDSFCTAAPLFLFDCELSSSICYNFFKILFQSKAREVCIWDIALTNLETYDTFRYHSQRYFLCKALGD